MARSARSGRARRSRVATTRETRRRTAATDALAAPRASGPLFLSGPVGEDGVNDPGDVRRVKRRLIALGFEWLADDEDPDEATIDAIRLFQAVTRARQSVQGTGVDGRIDPGGRTHLWLQAANPPRWGKMPAGGSVLWGFRNVEVLEQTGDDHDWGTSWLGEVTVEAGRAFRDDYLAAHPGRALITINDTSKPKGGPTSDHQGHQTGLCCDIRLPRLDGTAPGSTTHRHPQYDRESMRAMLEAFHTQQLVTRILFNDAALVRSHLCEPFTGHDDHAHVEITAPGRT